MMNQKAFQDYYSEELSHCYGCGRLNEHGLKIRSYWDGQEAVAVLDPCRIISVFPATFMAV